MLLTVMHIKYSDIQLNVNYFAYLCQLGCKYSAWYSVQDQKTVSLDNMIDRNASSGWLSSHKQKTVSLDNMIDRNASRVGGFHHISKRP